MIPTRSPAMAGLPRVPRPASEHPLRGLEHLESGESQRDITAGHRHQEQLLRRGDQQQAAFRRLQLDEPGGAERGPGTEIHDPAGEGRSEGRESLAFHAVHQRVHHDDTVIGRDDHGATHTTQPGERLEQGPVIAYHRTRSSQEVAALLARSARKWSWPTGSAVSIAAISPVSDVGWTRQKLSSPHSTVTWRQSPRSSSFAARVASRAAPDTSAAATSLTSSPAVLASPPPSLRPSALARSSRFTLPSKPKKGSGAGGLRCGRGSVISGGAASGVSHTSPPPPSRSIAARSPSSPGSADRASWRCRMAFSRSPAREEREPMALVASTWVGD